MDIIILGERARGPRGSHSNELSHWQQVRMLSLIPPQWTVSSWLNLLPPHPVPGTWNVREAQVAGLALRESLPRPSVVLACGSRVAMALQGDRYPQSYGSLEVLADGILYGRLPRAANIPSKLNRAAIAELLTMELSLHYSGLLHFTAS